MASLAKCSTVHSVHIKTLGVPWTSLHFFLQDNIPAGTVLRVNTPPWHLVRQNADILVCLRSDVSVHWDPVLQLQSLLTQDTLNGLEPVRSIVQ